MPRRPWPGKARTVRPAEEFLYEHVHLNFEGNYLVARALAEQIGHGLSAGAERPWPTAEDCARRLGWNDSTRRAAEMDILSRLNDPPFKEQANNRQQYQRLRGQIEQLQPATLPDSLREEKARTKAAADAATNDWILQENLAHLQQQTGDADGAVESLQRVVRSLPQSPEAWQGLGLALEAAKRDAEASAAFREASRLRPESVASLNSLAELHAREGRTEEAAREFEEVLREKPYWGPAHLGLGKALEAMGRTQEAKRQFEEALKNRISTPESFNTLGKFSFSRGWTRRRHHQFRRFPPAGSLRSRDPGQSGPDPGQAGKARGSQGPLRGSRPFATQLRRGPFLSWIGTGQGR